MQNKGTHNKGELKPLSCQYNHGEMIREASQQTSYQSQTGGCGMCVYVSERERVCDVICQVCLKAEYKEMLTNAVAEVRSECAHTKAQYTNICTHTHARATTLRNDSVKACKYDRDLAESGHLALAAEQTKVIASVYVCPHMCGGVFSLKILQNGKRRGEKERHSYSRMISQLEICTKPRPGQFSSFTSCKGSFNVFH